MNQAEVLEAIGNRIRSESIRYQKDPIVAVQLAVMVSEYVRHYWPGDSQRFETIGVELELVNDVVNPETGKSSRTWKHAGKLDGLVFDRFEGEEVIVEHKSTTDGLEPWSPYWRRLQIDSQVSEYLLSARQAGRDTIRTVLYDVVKKPTTNPKSIVAKDVRGIAESGKYFGADILPAELDRIRREYENNKGTKGGFKGKLSESLHLYSLRLRSLIRSAPEVYFQRRPIVRTDADLIEYARELWQLSKELRDSQRAGIAPRNTSACNSYNRLCEFFSVCTSEKSEDSDDFIRADFVHSELESEKVRQVSHDGRSILTNSRLTTFQSCRKREQLRYQVGLRPANGVDSDALHWGTLFHDLMEIVWRSYFYSH